MHYGHAVTDDLRLQFFDCIPASKEDLTVLDGEGLQGFVGVLGWGGTPQRLIHLGFESEYGLCQIVIERFDLGLAIYLISNMNIAFNFPTDDGHDNITNC